MTKIKTSIQLQIRKLKPFLPILLIIVVAGLLISIANPPPSQSMTGSYGWFDLRGLDTDNSIIHLLGGVEYAPYALLTPDEFTAWANENETLFGGTSAYQVVTSRMRFYARDGKWYTFSRNSIDYSHRLFVNGEWLLDIGRPGATPQTDIPNTGRVTFTAQGVDGVIEIVQQSTNHVHRSGGGHSWWTVGTGTLLSDWVRAEQYQTNIILGSFLMLALLFLVLFFTHGKNIGALVFAAFCITWFFRMGVTGGRVFTVIFPWLDWFFKFRVEYIAIPLSAIFTLAIVNVIFKNTLPKWGRYFLYAISVVAVALFSFLDTAIMRDVLDIILIIYGAAIVGLFTCLYILYPVKQKKSGQPAYNTEQIIFLAGVTIFVGAAFTDFGFVAAFIPFINMPPFHFTGVAMLVFALCEANAVFIANMKEFEKTKKSERHLADENTTLEGLSRTKTEYLSNMSHEIKTPLTVISGNIQRTEIIIEKSMTPDSECIIGAADLELINRSLAKAKEESMRMARITESVLRMAAMQESREKMKPLDAVTLFTISAEAHRGIVEKQGNTLEIAAEDGLPQIYGNADRLIQVLVNLLDNANRHTKDGLIRLFLNRENRFIRVAIADTGTGIPPNILPHIFERGITSGKFGGTGMGLAICKNIITAHGGEIDIKSEPGKGTTVTFTMPIFTERRETAADV